MLDPTLFAAFVATSLVVLITPGPGVLYVIARTLAQGHRAGFASVLGLSFGALFHVAAATLGLSALLMTSATAFPVVKYIGAAYLIYLGLRALLDNRTPGAAQTPKPTSLRRLFADGMIVSLFNPKIAVFFLAFLPHFVDPTLGNATAQFALLGVTYATLALFTDGAYCLFATSLRHLASARLMQGPWLGYMTGVVFIALGLAALLSERKT